MSFLPPAGPATSPPGSPPSADHHTVVQAQAQFSSAYVAGHDLLHKLSSQVYTAERLCGDCAQRGRRMLADTALHGNAALTKSYLAGASSADLARLARVETFADAFALVRRELEEAASTLVPLAVPGLGVFGFRLFNLGISIPFFDLQPKFADQHGLTREQRSLHQRGGSAGEKNLALQRLNLAQCAKAARLPLTVFKEVLRRLWSRLGRVMASGAVVDVDFGVGTLRCEDRCPSFDFAQRLDPGPGKHGGRRVLIGRDPAAVGGTSGSSSQRMLPVTTATGTPRPSSRGRGRGGGGGGGGGGGSPTASGAPTSLARIPNAARTVKIGVQRQAHVVQQSASSFRPRGRGGTGTGYYRQQQQPQQLQQQQQQQQPRPPAQGAPRGGGGGGAGVQGGRRLVGGGGARASDSRAISGDYFDPEQLSYGPPQSPGAIRNTSPSSPSSSSSPLSPKQRRRQQQQPQISGPALLDNYCRTRCATLEDVVYIRNVVDRVGR